VTFDYVNKIIEQRSCVAGRVDDVDGTRIRLEPIPARCLRSQKPLVRTQVPTMTKTHGGKTFVDHTTTAYQAVV